VVKSISKRTLLDLGGKPLILYETTHNESRKRKMSTH
jgi:hypothetical protein